MTSVETTVRETTPADRDAIVRIHTAAFGGDAEAALATELLEDASARPCVSLLALHGREAVGHILFTRCRIEGAEAERNDCYLLAPLAVVPDCQRRGIGGLLLEKGAELLRERGVRLLFVLGHEEYYPRHGFRPDAGKLGFPTPYPLPARHDGCWMVRVLSDTDLTEIDKGRILCAEALNRPEYWSK